MEFVWDEEKNQWLKAARNISFEDVVRVLLERGYLAILEHPTRQGQMIFLIEYNRYTYAVPFEIEDDRLVLKTAFPSRKFHKSYAEKKRET